MAANKFWNNDQESESSSESESSDSDTPQAQTVAPVKAAAKRWAEESSSDDEGPGKKRVVKKASDKRFDAMIEQIKSMKQHVNIEDFSAISTDLQNILASYEKVQKLPDFEGTPPNQLIACFAKLERFVEDKHVELQEKKASTGKPPLPENKQRAFNTLRAKVRKTIRQDYQDLVEKYKENPEEFADEKESEPEDDSDSDSEPASGQESDSASSSDDSDSDSSSGSDSDSSSSSSGSDSDSDSSSSDSDSDSDSDSSSSSSSKNKDSDVDDDDEDAVREKVMLRWVITDEKLAKYEAKREEVDQDKKKKDEKTKDKTTKKKTKESKTDKVKDDKDDKKKPEKEEYTPAELKKKINEIAAQRGRKGFDRRSYAEKLMELMPHAAKIGPRPQLHIYCSLISADFDGAGHAFDAMKISLWNEAIKKVTEMLPIVAESFEESKNEEKPQETEGAGDDDEEDVSSHERMQELFVAFIEKLDDELYKALQFASDVYGSEYQEILANSSKFLILLRRALKFFEKTDQPGPLGATALRVIEHLYYKPDMLNKAVFDAIHHTSSEEEQEDWVWPEDSRAHIAKLCQFVHARKAHLEPDSEETSEQQRLQRRASLCQAYHLALHDHFQQARDMLLLGNLWERAMECADVHTQILYHRVVAQMGLCAFRIGKMQEAHSFLAELCMHNKAKELLAQGPSFNRNIERTPQQEREEKLRQQPYHMHINLEVMDSAHHICAMLLEVPNLAMQSIDPTNKKIHSRVLRRALESHEKQQFSGPPENNKESVVTAAKALQRGEWNNACAAIEDLKLWAHIQPGQPAAGEKVKEMVKEKIKTEALRTYLFAYASIYDAFHLDQLVDMFGLPARGKGSVHSIVSKMMIREEITAFWDESSNYVLMQHSEPTPLQRLALSLADKGAQAVDNNERLVTQKTGDFGFKDAAPVRYGQGGGQGPRRMGKGGQGMGPGGPFGAGKGGAKGKGKQGGYAASGARPPRDRGWGNARAMALGGGQRGWSAPSRNQ